MDAAKKSGFKVYPETSNWDILLVGPDGSDDQHGVQAKLRANVDVLAQTVPQRERWGVDPFTGPRYRCVAVPKATDAFRKMCFYNRIRLLVPDKAGDFHVGSAAGKLKTYYLMELGFAAEAYYDWNPQAQ